MGRNLVMTTSQVQRQYDSRSSRDTEVRVMESAWDMPRGSHGVHRP